jgi:hypothetical protein
LLPSGYTVVVHQTNTDAFNITQTDVLTRFVDVAHSRTATQWSEEASHADDTREIQRGDLSSPTTYTLTTLPDGKTKMCTPRPIVNPISTDWAWLDGNATDEGPSSTHPGCEVWQKVTSNQYGNTTYVLHLGSGNVPVAQVVTGVTMAPSGKPRISVGR